MEKYQRTQPEKAPISTGDLSAIARPDDRNCRMLILSNAQLDYCRSLPKIENYTRRDRAALLNGIDLNDGSANLDGSSCVKLGRRGDEGARLRRADQATLKRTRATSVREGNYEE